MKYSVFVPCYNEEKIIEQNIKLILKSLKGFTKSFELVLVNDGSTDETGFILDELSHVHKKIRVLHFKGPSRRENLLRAFKKARGEVVAFMDADLATDLKSLPDLLDLKGFDLAIGNRYLPDSVIDRKRDRLLISSVFNGLMRFLFNSELRDHYIGFKSFRKEVILALLKLTGVGVVGRKMFWDAEMLVWAQQKGYKIKQVPVKWTEGEKSALGFFKDLSMIPYIIKFFFKFRFGGVVWKLS